MSTRPELEEADFIIDNARRYHGYIAPVTLTLHMMKIIIVLLIEVREALRDQTYQPGAVPYQQ